MRHIDIMVVVIFASATALAMSGCDVGGQAKVEPKLSELDQLVVQAERGDSVSEMALAKRYSEGDGVVRDQSRAYSLYLSAAEHGSVAGMKEVISRIRDSNGTSASEAERIRWIHAAAQAGDAESQTLVAEEFGATLRKAVWIQGKSKEEQEKNFAQWRSWMEKASSQGYAPAKYSLGFAYLIGTTASIFDAFVGVTTPGIAPEKGAALVTEAAESGEWRAQLTLAIAHQVGYGPWKKDTTKSNAWWDRLDSQTDPAALYKLGTYYEAENAKYYVKGENKWRGSELSFAETNARAFEWFKRSSESGNPAATLKVAFAYLYGKGTWTSDAEAFRNFLKAADERLMQAQYQVGLAYAKGSGTSKDYASALKYFQLAASNRGTAGELAEPKYALGVLHEYGWGTAPSTKIAYAWYNVSAAAGHKKAKEALVRLEKDMPSELVAEAQRLSREWKPGETMGGAANANSANAFSKGDKANSVGVASGSGFIVSRQGHIVTNHHVVAACSEIWLPHAAKSARLLVSDAKNDLALLSADIPGAGTAEFAEPDELRQGEEVVVFGFPLEGYLPTAGNVTLGIVSALAGPGNNSSLIQISAPVQPGNSGGPVLDRKGRIVGVVVGKADAIKVAAVTGDIPQNVNFAISGQTVRSFLQGNRVEIVTPWRLVRFEKSADKLADIAREIAVKIECRM